MEKGPSAFELGKMRDAGGLPPHPLPQEDTESANCKLRGKKLTSRPKSPECAINPVWNSEEEEADCGQKCHSSLFLLSLSSLNKCFPFVKMPSRYRRLG